MEAQHNNSSEEDLSKYKKRGYEYVEEEKAVLDEIVMLYRKRQEITLNHLRALEELRSTANAKFDSTNSLYGSLASPILDGLQQDIESHRRYILDSGDDLAKITFSVGSGDIAKAVRRDMEAVKDLYSEYTTLSSSVLQLPQPRFLDRSNWKWPYEEDIKHRRITAKLHTKQKAARLHFEMTYPKLLDDHMEYIEQVKRLSLSNTTRRSELSTTTACNASRERMQVDKVSTADVIAVPHLKMSLEKDRREYRHAPVFNVLTRRMEEDRRVIFGREMEPGPGDDVIQEVIMVCLERWPMTNWFGPVHKDWKYYWDIILAMELDPSRHAIRNAISNIQKGRELEHLVCIVVTNSPVTRLLLTHIDDEAMRRLKKNEWDRSALMDVMKIVDPRIQRIFKACANVWITTSFFHQVTDTVLRNWGATGGGTLDNNVIEVIFWMWDHELWRPLPDDVQWKTEWINGKWCACRMKRFRPKPEYKGSRWVWLEVDENGDVLDTPENEQEKEWIQEEPIKEPKFRLSKFLRKLNV